MTNPTLTAAFWMSGAISSFTLMAVAGRAVSPVLDTFEIMFFRSLIGIAVVLAFASRAGTLNQVSTARIRLHLVRNITHFAGQNLWFFALALIPLAQVFALEFTGPIWVLVLSPFLLGERITAIKTLAAVLGFAGIMIVARPDFQNLDIGVLSGAAAAIFFALTAIFTRQLTQTDTITCIMVWLTCMQAVFGLICAGYDADITLPTLEILPWLVVIGFAGLSAHFCLTRALSLAPASIVMPMDFVRLPVIMAVGALFYQEPIDLWVLAGAVLIFTGNWINLSPPKRAKA